MRVQRRDQRRGVIDRHIQRVAVERHVAGAVELGHRVFDGRRPPAGLARGQSGVQRRPRLLQHDFELGLRRPGDVAGVFADGELAERGLDGREVAFQRRPRIRLIQVQLVDGDGVLVEHGDAYRVGVDGPCKAGHDLRLHLRIAGIVGQRLPLVGCTIARTAAVLRHHAVFGLEPHRLAVTGGQQAEHVDVRGLRERECQGLVSRGRQGGRAVAVSVRQLGEVGGRERRAVRGRRLGVASHVAGRRVDLDLGHQWPCGRAAGGDAGVGDVHADACDAHADRHVHHDALLFAQVGFGSFGDRMFVAVRVDHLQRELHAAVGLAFLELEPYAVDLTGLGVVELEPCRRGAVAGHPCGRLAVHQRAGVLGRVLGGRRRDGGRGGDVHAFDGVAGLLQQFEFGERRPCGATDRPRELHGDVFDLLAKIRRIHLIEGALVLRLVDQCPLGTVSEPRDDPELEQAADRLEHEPHAVHTLRRRQVDPIPVRVGPVADPQRTVVAVVAVRRGPLAGAGACGAAERQVRVLGLRLRGSPDGQLVDAGQVPPVRRMQLPTHLGAEYVGGDLVLGADGIGFAAAYLDPSRAVPDLDLVAQREVGRDLLQGDAGAGDRIRAAEVDHQRGVGLARLRPAGVGVAVGHVRDDGAGVLVGHVMSQRQVRAFDRGATVGDVVHRGDRILVEDDLAERFLVDIIRGFGRETIPVLVAFAVRPLPAVVEPVRVGEVGAVLQFVQPVVHVRLPPPIVVVAGQPGPLAVGIVDERAVLVQTPRGDERTRVELEQVGGPIVRAVEHRAGIVDPCAHEEVVRAGKQLVLRLDDVQHPGRQCPERLQIARLVRLPGERLGFLEAVGQHLPHHVDVIVAEAGRVLVRVIRLLEQGRGLLELPLVVIYVAVAPRGRRADGVVGRAGVDDGFARTLIVFAVRVLVGGVKQDVPRLLDRPVGSAVPALGILLRPGAIVDRILLPGHVEQQLVDDRRIVDGFGRDADAAHVTAGVVGFRDVLGDHLRHSVKAHASAEVVQHVPHPRHALVLHRAGLRAQVALQVEHERLALVREPGELRLVDAPLPLLHHPHGRRVMVEHLALHGAVDVDDVEAVWNHAALMERIDRVVVRHLAEHVLLSFVERVADLLEVVLLAGRLVGVGQIRLDHVRAVETGPCAGRRGHRRRVLLLEVGRHLTAEALDDRRDAVRLHAVVDPAAELDALLEPCGGQGASDRVQVLHVEPCVVSRPGQVFAHLVVAVAVLGERLAQHLLLSDDVEHEVHAVHRRPVEERLVIIPVPERHRVRVGAEVERVPVLVVRVFEDFPADCRQALRHGQLGAEQRVVVDLAPVAQIIIEAGRERDAVVAADGDPAVAGV